MHSLPLLTRIWPSKVWQHKGALISGFLAIVSLSLAHYAGFLMNVPLQIVSVAGLSFAKNVTATFLFYLFFSAVIARVLSSVLQLVVLPFVAINDLPRLGRPIEWSQQRRFVRSHTQTIKWEGAVWVVVQGFVFFFMMLALYLKFATTWVSVTMLLISVAAIIASGLMRSGFFLQPKPKSFIRKTTTRPARSGRAISAAFVTTTAAMIVVAFFMGGMRASLLRDQVSQRVVSKEFEGKATVIASAEGALLLYQKEGTEFRYVYSSPEFTTSIESKDVFPPIGSKTGR